MSDQLTQNINFLSPLGFRFLLNKIPNVEYFCQSVSLPTISMSEAIQSNPLVNIPRPGDRLTYDALTVRFRVDENMTNYLEIHDWLVGLGHPDNLNQYRDLSEKVSDASLIILTSNNNANVRISFQDVFPVSLEPLLFDTTQTDIEFLEVSATFRYKKFTIEPLNR